jgi:hypothetical protein
MGNRMPELPDIVVYLEALDQRILGQTDFAACHPRFAILVKDCGATTREREWLESP